jgi:hypothetical protein
MVAGEHSTNEILCKCGELAHKCTYLHETVGSHDIVGLLIYSDTEEIDKYVDNFNKQSKQWIESRFHEHIHLCYGSDRAVALLALSYQDIFKNVNPEYINNNNYFNKNAETIKMNIIDIAHNRISYIFKLAKEVRYIYGSQNESKIHIEISWSLVGRKSFGRRESCGLLPLIYNLFQENPSRKILLQVNAPDGSVNNTTHENYSKSFRYWDIKFHISSCGKVEAGEDNLSALLRETEEEIDLNLDSISDKLVATTDTGINMYYYNMTNFIPANNFIEQYSKWGSPGSCIKCRTRYLKHRPSTVIYK